MTIQNVIQSLEELAPRAYQESYDNSGLLVGNAKTEVTGALLTLDVTEAVLDEAKQKGCNLVVAHHPIIFSGLKRITGSSYVERIVIKAIKEDLAIFAIHTNLDNVAHGVNKKIADKIGLTNTRILAPKRGVLRKLYTFCPQDHAETVLNALFAAGAGTIGQYDECSFSHAGTGTFRAGEGTNPYVGEKGARHAEAEAKLEVVFPAHLQGKVTQALQQAHPYEEVAYDVVQLENKHPQVGAGMIGVLPEPMEAMDFLKALKDRMGLEMIRYTALGNKPIKKVAVCGGAGSFLLSNAMGAGAQVFITADYKYHQFFDADGKIIIADIGHYESERFTQELLLDFLSEKFSTFALHLSETNTNPINYL